MTVDLRGDHEYREALERAHEHVEAAENVLWETAAQSDDPDRTARLEALTQSIWALQHDLMDAQQAVDRRDSREAIVFE